MTPSMIKYTPVVLWVSALAACGPARKAAWEQPVSASAPTAHASSENVPSLQEQASAAWAQREDRAHLEQAIVLWEQITQIEPQDAASLTSLARAYYLLADGHMRLNNQEDLMLGTFEKGVLAGERALMALSPAFAEAVKTGTKVEVALQSMPSTAQASMYWYATNLGKFAILKGFTTTLFYKERIFSVMQRVMQIDETFYYGAPHRYFGAYYAKAPAFAGGDPNKSKEHFTKALQIAPDYLATKVLYAEYYATKTENKELFTELLKDVEKADPTALVEIIPEQHMEQEKAKRLLAKTTDLF
jgi:tetratricopeptide (TPR) repeat protein